MTGVQTCALPICMAKFYYRKAVHTPAEDYLQPGNGTRMRANSMYLLRKQRTSSESAMSILEHEEMNNEQLQEHEHQNSGEKTTNDSSFSSSNSTSLSLPQQQQNQNQNQHQLMSRHNRRLSRSVADLVHSTSNL